MLARRFLLCIALTLFGASPAVAYVRNLVFSHSPASAYEPIGFSVDAGVCHGFYQPDVAVTVNGSIVDAVIVGQQHDDFIVCNEVPFHYQFTMAGLPPGDYTIRLRIRNIVAPFQTFPPVIQGQLRVREPPYAVPAGSQVTMAILSIGILLLGTASFARR